MKFSITANTGVDYWERKSIWDLESWNEVIDEMIDEFTNQKGGEKVG